MDQWKNIILERIDKLIKNKKYLYISYKTKIDIDYEDIETIWDDFIIRKYSDKSDNNSIINLKKNSDFISLKIAIGDEKLSIILEELFLYHIKCQAEDLIFLYLKDSDEILVKLKSFSPLLYKKTISLPFWSLYITDTEIKNQMKENLKNNDDISIFCYC